MYGLPESTIVNRKIPKKKFYENLNVSPSLKRNFVEEIQAIYWSNKIAPSTVNVQEGSYVKELEVFTIELNGNTLNEAVLRQIDREIPYHILFVLKYEGKYQAWIAYKGASGNNQTAFKVEKYYHSEWQDEYSINLNGLSTDDIYQTFVRQIAGDSLQNNGNETLEESVKRDKQVQQLQKQIDALQAKVRKEKQLNNQINLNSELKRLRKELKQYEN